jgi:hypothetical protein
MPFKINWDNGSEACGTFPYEFDTEEEATDYGNDWVATMEGIDPGPYPENRGYTFEVFEDEAEEDSEGVGHDATFEQNKAGLSNGRP